MAQLRGTVTDAESIQLVAELNKIPGKLEEVLRSVDDQCAILARVFHTSNDFLFLGRGIHYPIALEGALKLKEISYIHAEGYPAGEMKHGPNALIDETLPVVVHRHAGPGRPRLRPQVREDPQQHSGGHRPLRPRHRHRHRGRPRRSPSWSNTPSTSPPPRSCSSPS